MIWSISLPLRQPFSFRMESQNPTFTVYWFSWWRGLSFHSNTLIAICSRNKCGLTGLYLLISWNGPRLQESPQDKTKEACCWCWNKFFNARNALGCPFHFHLKQTTGLWQAESKLYLMPHKCVEQTPPQVWRRGGMLPQMLNCLTCIQADKDSNLQRLYRISFSLMQDSLPRTSL